VFADEVLGEGIVEEPVAAQFHGGFFCPIEFAGNTLKID